MPRDAFLSAPGRVGYGGPAVGAGAGASAGYVTPGFMSDLLARVRASQAGATPPADTGTRKKKKTKTAPEAAATLGLPPARGFFGY